MSVGVYRSTMRFALAFSLDEWVHSSIDRTPALCWCKPAAYAKPFIFRPAPLCAKPYLQSLGTAYPSFGGEVEASSTSAYSHPAASIAGRYHTDRGKPSGRTLQKAGSASHRSATGDVNRARSNPRSNGEFGTVNQRLQLGPGDLGMAAAAEAAISAGHHILPPHETPEAADALSH